MTPFITCLDDVKQAAIRIASYCRVTPLLESILLNQLLGLRVLIKAENLQWTGSFKVRGAFNHLLQLTKAEKKRGIVAISSGNHAQAVAYAVAQFGVAATIIMPQDAPALKLANTRGYGANVITYNRATEDREVIGRAIAEEKGLVLIHPYDALRTIAGQGTVGLEIHYQCQMRDLIPDAIIVNCSGGGLSSGIALTRALYPKPPQIFTSEPADFNDTQRSLLAGRRVQNEKRSGSICDALMADSPGIHTFDILMQQQARGFTATDPEVEAGMHVAMEHFKQTLEPGGAVSLACALNHAVDFHGKTVVVVASGGNVDPADYMAMLARGQAARKTFWPALNN